MSLAKCSNSHPYQRSLGHTETLGILEKLQDLIKGSMQSYPGLGLLLWEGITSLIKLKLQLQMMAGMWRIRGGDSGALRGGLLSEIPPRELFISDSLNLRTTDQMRVC